MWCYTGSDYTCIEHISNSKAFLMTQLLGLIFDLDGTLVDSLADFQQALNTVLTEHERRKLSLEEVRSMFGDGAHRSIHRAFALTGEPLSQQDAPVRLTRLIELCRTQKATPEQIYPQAKETLIAFRDKGVKIGLCTNKIYLSTLKLLDDIDLADLFDFIAGVDTFPFCKPHPDHVLGVAKGLAVSPQNCVMIGDSANDIRAAKAAGVANIAVSHGYGRDIHELGADRVISGLAELPLTLRHLGFDFVG